MLKIAKTEIESLFCEEKIISLLFSGGFYELEKILFEAMIRLYNELMERIILYVVSQFDFQQVLRETAKSKGLKKLVSRPCSLELRTGHKVNYESFYAKETPADYEGERHISRLHWDCQLKASPMYSSLITMNSILAPSFDVASRCLNYQGICVTKDRTRKIALGMASQCIKNRVGIQLNKEETLKGCRVIIEIDGGRTLMRESLKDGTEGEKESKRFSAQWREPKLFIITILGKDGKVVKDSLPIYDASFGDDETFKLLETYLFRLEIHKAAEVQFIADGAPWIWNRAKKMLIGLGVSEDKITETLDYYHGSEHISELTKYMKTEVQASALTQLKDHLWKGDIKGIAKVIKKHIPDVDLNTFTPYQYFYKHRHRIDYQGYSERKLLCGSGLIESGIRRIINLRFKGSSSFWYQENVEKLILMRCILLSGRWEIMMRNLTT